MNVITITSILEAVKALARPAVILALVCGGLPLPAQAATQVIRMVNFAFQPSSVTIHEGDTVRWTNTTATGHNVVSSSGAWAPSALFTSPGTFSVTFTKAGTYNYVCSPHQALGMTGTIVVQAAAKPPTIIVTNPLPGITLAAPAMITLRSEASAPAGQVVSVTYFSSGTSVGVVSNSPYSLLLSNLVADTYRFTAKALDNAGNAATSAVVTVSVVAPGAISFQTNFSSATASLPLRLQVTPGLRYAIESTRDFLTWLPWTNFLATNTVMSFSSQVDAADTRFFRARLEPNP
jgi:plastocyanin